MAKKKMNIFRDPAINMLLAIPFVGVLARKKHDTGIGANENKARKIWTTKSRDFPDRLGHVLEIGTGIGFEMAKVFLENGAQKYTTVDIAEYNSNTNPPDGVEYIIYDGVNLPIESDSVDLIFSNWVFEHVRRPKLLVDEMSRVLCNGGRLVSEVDIRDHYQSEEIYQSDHLVYPKIIWEFLTYNRSAYTNRLRPSEWREIFVSAGFEIEIKDRNVSDQILKRVSGNKRITKKYSPTEAATTSFTIVAQKLP